MDKIWHFLARKMPRRLRYLATIVAGSEATTGSWSGTEVPSVLFMDVLQRIRK